MSFYPPVTPVRKCLFSIRGHPALDAGSIPSRHPALDAGSSPVWIPAFAGMTDGGRECPFLRHPALDAGSSPSRHPALDAGSRQKDWIPVFTGMTHPFVILNRKRSASDWGSGDCRLDSRFHGNDKRRMRE